MAATVNRRSVPVVHEEKPNNAEYAVTDPTTKLLTDKFPSPEEIREGVLGRGLQIFQDAIDPDAHAKIKAFWLDYFTHAPAERLAARGNLVLGEANFNSYSDNEEWCLYRNFDFLWNEPYHALSRQLYTAVHRRRNLAQGFPENYGLEYNPQSYGVYGSTSYYPPGNGWMKAHSDGHRDLPIMHFMIAITSKGVDYKAGGLVVTDGKGNRIDIEAEMKPGSVLLYDGRLMHGVERIEPFPGKNVGRIAMFAIPTFFHTQQEMPRLIGRAQSGWIWANKVVQARFGLQTRVKG
jgi:hypothetical protein